MACPFFFRYVFGLGLRGSCLRPRGLLGGLARDISVHTRASSGLVVG